MFTPSKAILKKYSSVLINFALNSGKGIKKGDRVCIYMPMIPEAVIAMLACARIGAIHSVVFGGFASDSLRDRIVDCEASCVLTQDGAPRRGKVVPLKATVDAEGLALEGSLLLESDRDPVFGLARGYIDVVQARAPVGVFALTRIRVFVEVRAVKQTKAVVVTREVRGNPVENHADTGTMASIDEVSEVVR